MPHDTSLTENAPGAGIMYSPLESLPSELLDGILDWIIDHDQTTIHTYNHFDYRPLSRLSQCSRSLYYRIEPLLYATQNARNLALRHGCKTGNLNAIRKTVSRGTNPGTIQMYMLHNSAPDRDPSADFRVIFSLQVALKAQQLEAFRLLLKLGAGVGSSDCPDDNVRKSQLHSFGQRLSEPWNVEFLTAFLEARRETPNWPDRVDGPSQARVLACVLPLPHIVRWGTPELLETLLYNGAPVNHAALTRTDPGKGFLTPLSAAALRGDIGIFHLLIARGANVNVEGYAGKFRTRYTHVPSIMAAQFMARHGNANMLQACVDAGADINQLCHIDLDPLAGNNREKHVCTTPLLMYLDSIESWNAPIPTGADEHLLPTDGVAFLIHDLGAKVQNPLTRPIERRYNNIEQELHDRTFGGIPSPVELLLDKWGIESLANSEFFSAIKLLVEHGGTEMDLARILVRFDGQNEAASDVDLEGLWQSFLTLLMPQITLLDQNRKNALLRRVITDKAGLRNRVAYPSHWVRIQAIGRASIDAVISVGADINDISPHNAKWPQMNTPLHQVVSSFIHTDRLTDDNLHDHDVGHICPRSEKIATEFGDFLAFLVNRGADPFIEDMREHCVDERTAVDTLVSPMKQGRVEFVGGTTERSLMYLVARLRGITEVTEYTGYRLPYDKYSWRHSFRSNHYWGDDVCTSDLEAGTW